MQLDLIPPEENRRKEVLLNEDGIIEHYPCVFPEHWRLLEVLQQEVHWSQDKIKLFGKLIPIPRLQAWYGDNGVEYTYSGLTMSALLWTKTLQKIKMQVEQLTSEKFNSVLCNYYRNGRDYVAYHSDDEPELGKFPVIASVSLGVNRVMGLKHRFDKNKELKFSLLGGSLHVSRGAMQEMWQHSLLKRPSIQGPRINLTFRKILTCSNLNPQSVF